MLGEQLTRLLEEMRALKTGIADLKAEFAGLKAQVATKEQLGLVWRSVELKLDLRFDREHDAVAEVRRALRPRQPSSKGARALRSGELERSDG